MIFGASRNTGLHIAQLAVQKGLSVVAMVREGSDTTELEQLNIEVEKGDAFCYNECVALLEKYHARNIITTLGGKNKEGRRVDAEGNINIIKAVESTGQTPKRFVLVTSMGSGEQYEHISEQAQQFLGDALRAKTEAENYLRNTTLPWSIIRPGGLNHEPASGQYRILHEGESIQNAGYLSRKDVAQASLEIMDEPTYLRCAVTVC